MVVVPAFVVVCLWGAPLGLDGGWGAPLGLGGWDDRWGAPLGLGGWDDPFGGAVVGFLD